MHCPRPPAPGRRTQAGPAPERGCKGCPQGSLRGRGQGSPQPAPAPTVRPIPVPAGRGGGRASLVVLSSDTASAHLALAVRRGECRNDYRLEVVVQPLALVFVSGWQLESLAQRLHRPIHGEAWTVGCNLEQ